MLCISDSFTFEKAVKALEFSPSTGFTAARWPVGNAVVTELVPPILPAFAVHSV